jgi:hypothetical protein
VSYRFSLNLPLFGLEPSSKGNGSNLWLSANRIVLFHWTLNFRASSKVALSTTSANPCVWIWSEYLIPPSSNIYGGGDSTLFDNGEGGCLWSTLTALVDLTCTPYFLWTSWWKFTQEKKPGPTLSGQGEPAPILVLSPFRARFPSGHIKTQKR